MMLIQFGYIIRKMCFYWETYKTNKFVLFHISVISLCFVINNDLINIPLSVWM